MPQPAGADAVGVLPFVGAPPADGSAQAVAIAPTPQAANAADTGPPNDSQNPFLVFTVVFMAIPILLTMTLLATVLTRR
ncbi:MAG TPA: hypothetical protein VGR77_03065 [Candidatus Dormibacteraeota bacterium]|nr:hypothetical protein [Candidatus Dormibacteraeota bacterium]